MPLTHPQIVDKLEEIEEMLQNHNFTGDADEPIYEAQDMLEELKKELGWKEKEEESVPPLEEGSHEQLFFRYINNVSKYLQKLPYDEKFVIDMESWLEFDSEDDFRRTIIVFMSRVAQMTPDGEFVVGTIQWDSNPQLANAIRDYREDHLLSLSLEKGATDELEA